MLIGLQQACQALLRGEIVAVPTETVYGLAACHNNEEAIREVFRCKERPLNHPLILHIGDQSCLATYAHNIPTYVQALIDAFWPGPLTLVLQKTDAVAPLITANQETIAIRQPRHPLLLNVLRQIQTPVVAPSANRFCQTSPTSPEHVLASLGQKIPVLDGGPCQVGIESTIVLATEPDHTTILRPGIISHEQIAKITGLPCLPHPRESIKVPGNLKRHYRPLVPLFAFEHGDHISSKLAIEQEVCLVMALHHLVPNKPHRYIQMPTSPLAYAKVLYQYWQTTQLDTVTKILIELPPNEPAWLGIRDRILKASSGKYGTR